MAYKRLDGSGVILSVTKWEVIGFMESEVVRWSSFQRVSNDEMAEIIEEEGFRLKEF